MEQIERLWDEEKQEDLVFESPVSRLQKDRNQTGLRLEKTGPAVLVF
jgi:hypothetical protein